MQAQPHDFGGVLVVCGLCLSGWILYHQSKTYLDIAQHRLDVAEAKVDILKTKIRALQQAKVKHITVNLLLPVLRKPFLSLNPTLRPVLFNAPSSRKSLKLLRISHSQIMPCKVVSNKKWLIIGIPTVPRANGVDYLSATVEAILQQIPDHESDPFYGKVKVVVLNHRPGEHPVFEKVKQWVQSSQKGRDHFSFVENLHPLKDATPGKRDAGNPNFPGYRVRHQTRDVASLLLHEAVKDQSHYFLFMEDDLRLCPHGLFAIRYLIYKAELYNPNWIAIRASYGMIGIFMRGGKDLTTFKLFDQTSKETPTRSFSS